MHHRRVLPGLLALVALSAALFAAAPARAEEPASSDIDVASTVDAEAPRWFGVAGSLGFPNVLEVALELNPLPWFVFEARVGGGLGVPEAVATGRMLPSLLFGGAVTGRFPVSGGHHLVGSLGSSYVLALAQESLESDPPILGPSEGHALDAGFGYAWVDCSIELRATLGVTWVHWLLSERSARTFDSELVTPALRLSVVWWPLEP